MTFGVMQRIRHFAHLEINPAMSQGLTTQLHLHHMPMHLRTSTYRMLTALEPPVIMLPTLSTLEVLLSRTSSLGLVTRLAPPVGRCHPSLRYLGKSVLLTNLPLSRGCFGDRIYNERSPGWPVR